MVKPIFILSGETTIEANLVWFLKDVLFSQNVLRSGVLVKLYPSHNWLFVLNQLKIVSLSMANKILSPALILFLSAERDGVAGVGVGDDAGSCFEKNTKYPAIPPIITRAKITTNIFENPF